MNHSSISVASSKISLCFVAVALGACGASPGEGSVACVSAPADAEYKESEAIEPPGQSTQGLARQGLTRQGLTRQGFLRQGTWSNAFWTNGYWSNGAWNNGAWSNGFWSNGIWQNGVWRNGLGRQGVTLQGTELIALSADGTPVAGADLVGAELELLNGERVAISSYDSSEADGALAWYTLSYKGENICGDGVKGLFVPGLWNLENGDRVPADQNPEAVAPFSFSCSTGVLAKCVIWGYQPWTGAAGSDLHQSCLRMAPADYCGNGVAHTENGTLIDIFDVDGIQVQESKPGEMTFEAAWGPDGAVCVNQTRYADEVVDQGPILPSCWNELPRCTSLKEGVSLGAKMANYSTQASRNFCEAPAEY